MITFQNDGEIDIEAVKTFGVSVKESANPVGFFGTGLKYAIAIILRHGGKIVINSGLERYVFTAEEKVIRGQGFSVIHMNGEALAFTTHMGANWALWQGFRELYCNATDEAGLVFSGIGEPVEGKTTIVVSDLPEFDEIFETRHQIFITSAPVHSFEQLEVRPGPVGHLSYRGIRALDVEEVCTFAYNITRPLVLTEDRTIKDMFSALMAIRRCIYFCTDKEFLWRWLTAPGGSFEQKLDLDYFDSEPPSDAFLETVRELMKEPTLAINPSAENIARKWRPISRTFEPCKLTTLEEAQLERGLKLCERLNYDVRKYPTIVVDNLGPGVLGRAVDKQIVIARRALTMGDRTLAGTLMEEYLHLDFLFKDESRDFQNYLIDLVIMLAETHIPPTEESENGLDD